MQDPNSELNRELHALLGEGEEEALRISLRLIRPEDVAGWFDLLDPDDRQQIFEALDYDAAGTVLNDTTSSIRAELIEYITHERLARIAEAMPADEAADLIGGLADHDTERILHHISSESEETLRVLLAYPEESAGGIMTPDVVAMSPESTVDDAIGLLRSASDDTVTAALYVVDAHQRLLGFVRLRHLVTAEASARLGDLMSTNVISVNVEMDQEEAAELVDRYDFIAVPVVDADQRLVGAVTVDDILDVIANEATEDIYKMAGSSVEEGASESILHVARYRLPWLLVCLAGTQLSTLVLTFAKSGIDLYEQMSVFTAAIMAMAGNTSLQSSTTTVRRIALDTLPRGRYLRHIVREVGVALLMGVVCGLLAALLAVAFGNDPVIGLALGAAMAMSMSAASMLGAAMPLALDIVGIDAAVSSGPLVSTINDSLALMLYFAVATGILFFAS